MNPSIEANSTLKNIFAVSLKMEQHLANIEKKFEEKDNKGAFSQTGSSEVTQDKSAITAIGGAATAISNLIVASQKMDEKSAETLTNFIKKFGEAITELEKNITVQSAENVSEIINTIVKGSTNYLKQMSVAAILGVPALVGTTLFALNVKILFKILGELNVSLGTIDAMQSVVALSTKIIAFGASLALYNVIGAMAISGAVQFGLTIRAILGPIKNIESLTNPGLIDNLSKLGKAVVLISLPFVLLSFVKEQFVTGALTFSLGIAAVLGVLSLTTKSKDLIDSANSNITKIAFGVAIFSGTMVLLSRVAPEFAIGVLTFSLGVGAMSIIIGGLAGSAGVSGLGLYVLGDIGRGAALFALTMIGISFLAKEFAVGVLTFGLATGALLLIYGTLATRFPQITIATTALNDITKSALKFSIIMVGVGFLYKPFAMGALVFSLATVAVGGALALVGFMDSSKFVTTGANVLSKIALPSLLFSVSVIAISKLITESPDTLLEKLKVVGLSIGVLGVAAAIIGAPIIAPFASTGAGIMILLGGSLLVFSLGLGALSLVNTKNIDGDKIESIISSLVKGFAAAGIASLLIVPGSVALITAGVSLLTLLPSLFLFKQLNWKAQDSNSLNIAINGVVGAMTSAFGKISFKEFAKLFAGAALLAALGGAFVSLAIGVKAMSSLTFTEMEWDEKSQKMIPVREVRLVESDFANAAKNAATIINTLKQPLYDFGKAADDGTLFGLGVGNGYLQKGINTASTIGSAISNIAKGVQSMANLEVIEWEIVNPGTPNAKLVPKSSRKLNNADFKNAALNVKTILETLTNPLLEFGRQSEEGSGLFSGGFMEKGIETAKSIGDFIASLSDGVLKMANGEVIEYKIINPGTPEAKLVPNDSRKLIDDDFKKAANNVKIILETLANPLLEFGRQSKEGSGLFKDGYMDKGIDAISKIGQPIAAMGDMILKLANGQIVVNEIIDGKLVPSKVIPFKEGVEQAKIAITDLLSYIPNEVIKFGKFIDQNKSEFKKGEEATPLLESAMKGVAASTENYVKIAQNILEAKKTGVNIDEALVSMSKSIATVGESFEKISENKAELFTKMVTNIKTLSNISSPFQKFTKDFKLFVTETEKFIKNWKTFSEKNSLYWKGYVDNIVTLSKVDTMKLKEVTSVITESTINQQKNLEQGQKQIIEVAKNIESKTVENKSKSAERVEKTGTAKDQNYKETPEQLPAGTKQIANLHVTNLYTKK